MHWYTSYGQIELAVAAYIMRDVKPQKIITPFEHSSGVVMNSYSLKLQRIVTDFGIDESFADAKRKVTEHYGVDIPLSSIRKITLKHANAAQEAQYKELNCLRSVYSPRHNNKLPIGSTHVVVETDGTMIPIVETKGGNRRKNRNVCYREAKVTLAYKPGEIYPTYSATMAGVDDAGKRLRWCALKAGLGRNTFVHGVGDGAPWIVNQIEDKFGDVSHAYLIDLYHLREYLSSVSQIIHTDPAKQSKWVDLQVDYLKADQVSKVLRNINKYSDTSNVEHAEIIRACYRYIENRQGCNSCIMDPKTLNPKQYKQLAATLSNQREKIAVQDLEIQPSQLPNDGINMIIIHDNNRILGAMQNQDHRWIFLPPHKKTIKCTDIDSTNLPTITSIFKGYIPPINQLNYKGAISNQLPIGSGKIESSHRFIAQKRLKIPGAWWLPKNADAMLAMRTMRQNNGWHEYWSKLACA